MLLGVGAVAKKSYIDDCFSTYLYKGTGSSLSINNGIDVSGEGALVWLKSRSNSYGHKLTDTVRGSTKQINSDSAAAQSTSSDFISGFTSTGFTLGTDVDINSSSHTYSSWTSRKAPGFFDVVTFNTGNPRSTNQRVSHSLGCVPGMILIKRVDSSNNWLVHHRALGKEDYLTLNSSAAFTDGGGDTYVDPTATDFGYNAHMATGNDADMVAYVFAGGESTAATARSVDLDGAGDYLTTDQSSNYAMGTGDFTVEGWFKINSGTNYGLFMNNSSGLTNSYGVTTWYYTDYGLTFKGGSGTSHQTDIHPEIGQWFHLALVRNSSTTSLYYNGTFIKSASDNTDYTGERFVIGGYESATYVMNGSVSNFRVVKGTAVYTTSFRPPTEPLTSITNTKLLCCNNSSVTGATTGTVTSSGDPTASTDSPFDDPAGFVFGDAGDQNVIKCGSYVGSGSAGLEVNLGWEPQWLMVKRTNDTSNWHIVDSMRGIVSGGNDPFLEADTSNSGATGSQLFDLTPTGFTVEATGTSFNNSGSNYIFLAIRRPDGYVGKPPELGTDVFAMDAGNSSTTQGFTSGFPVDFALEKKTSATSNWEASGRLIQEKYLLTNSTNAEATFDKLTFDDNTGWNTHSGYDSVWQSFMWKRGAGFDIVNYAGGGAGTTELHSLNAVPEMIWVKCRSSAHDWAVYHKGLNGGTNPEQKYLMLNSSAAEVDNSNRWNDTAPTATTFTVGGNDSVGNSGDNYIAMLFASVDGISKVGSFVGSDSDQTITLGFQPRFLIVKAYNQAYSWLQLDTTRGWATSSGNNSKYLFLELNWDQDNIDVGYLTSTGFVAKGGSGNINESGASYIYYAHA